MVRPIGEYIRYKFAPLRRYDNRVSISRRRLITFLCRPNISGSGNPCTFTGRHHRITIFRLRCVFYSFIGKVFNCSVDLEKFKNFTQLLISFCDVFRLFNGLRQIFLDPVTQFKFLSSCREGSTDARRCYSGITVLI